MWRSQAWVTIDCSCEDYFFFSYAQSDDGFLKVEMYTYGWVHATYMQLVFDEINSGFYCFKLSPAWKKLMFY